MPSRQGGAMQARDRKESGLCDHAAARRQTRAGARNTSSRRRKAETTPGISAPGRKDEGEIFVQRGLFRCRAVPPESGQPGTDTGTEFRQMLTGFTGDSQNA